MHRAWKLLLPLACVALAAPAMAATTYTWNQVGSAAWTTASNWTPDRTTPAADDVLQFNGGGSVTVTGVPTQTIGQLLLSNSSSVALQPAAAATLTIAGDAGADLDIPAGSALVLNTAAALTFALQAPATGSVAGTVTVTTGAHRMTALGAGAIHFLNGSLISCGTGFSGNVFGTGAGTSALNSVVFESGSIYAQSAGSNPFGAGQPNSVVTFQAGSRYRLDGNLTPSFSGRTYADFEHNTTGPTSTTGGNPLSIDNLIVTQGALNIGMTGVFNLKGNIQAAGGTNLAFNPASAAAVTFSGTSVQTITASGAVSANANCTYLINNPAGLQLATNFAIVNPLTFTSGSIHTGAFQVNLGTSTSISNAGQGTGWIDGNVSWLFPSGTSSRTFPVGDATIYAPIDFSLNAAASSFPVFAKAPAGDHAQIGTSGLDPAKTVNRTYTLSVTGSPSFVTYDATFHFAGSDVDGAANPPSFDVKRWDGAAWNPTQVNARTATSIQIINLTSFSDFAIGNGGPVKNTDTGLTYATIQQCLDDPLTQNFHVIQIDPGTYVEQVEITKAVFIHGAGCGQTIIKSPAILPLSYANGFNTDKPIVWVHNTDAHLSNLTVDGDGKGTANSRFIGISFWNSSGGLHEVCVTNIQDTPFAGDPHGVGIQADNSGGGPYYVLVEASTVDEFQKSGMIFNGANLTVNVNNCTVTGKGPTVIIPQNGIEVSFGAGGVVYGNDIKELSYTPATALASGLLTNFAANLYAAGTDFTNVQTPVTWQDTPGTMDSLHATGGSDLGAIFISNSTGPGPSRGAPAGLLARPPSQPYVSRSSEAAAPHAQAAIAFTVNVFQSCFQGVDAPGTSGIGVATQGGPLTVTVEHCELSDWDLALEVAGNGATLTAHDNSIHGNVTAGYVNLTSVSQNAENNWWGAADGPSGQGPGSGDAISGSPVDFTPFFHSGADAAPGCGFYIVTHSIFASAGLNGSVSPPGGIVVNDGDDQAYAITPDPGYRIQDVLVDATSVGPVPTYTFFGVTADHTISATFAPDAAPTVSVLSPNGGESVVVATTATLTWNANDDFAVASVDLYLSRTGSAGPYTAIATGEPNDGSYSWLVTGPTTQDAWLKVVAYDDINQQAEDISDAAFNIDDKTAVVLALFAAEPVAGGIAVRWQFTDDSEVAATWVERAETVSGPWQRIDAAARRDGGVMTVVDDGAIGGRTYLYKLVAQLAAGGTRTFGPIEAQAKEVPSTFALARIAPNPMVERANIDYTVARSTRVKLSVIDLQGRTVATLVDAAQEPGRYTATWSGGGSHGRLASGVYFVCYEAGGQKHVARLLLAR